MPATAQELFADVLKSSFAPALRAAGLRGSGQSFTLPSDSHFALLGFQKSQFSDSRAVKFTVNIKVVPKSVWATMRAERPHFPANPSPNTGYGSFEWHQRIGKLLPGGEDQWWFLRLGDDNSSTEADVVSVLTHVAVPAMRTAIQATNA